MAGPLISFGGLNSGLDTKALIGAILSLRQKPIELMQAQRADFSTRKSRFTLLRDKVQELRDSARELKKSEDLLAFKASSSEETVLAASASGKASPGSFTVAVTQLAQSETEASSGFADFDTTAVGNGTIKLNYAGTVTDVVVTPGKETLEDVRDAINDSDAGVTATIVNTGTGATPYQLVVTGNDTGATNTISIDLTSFTGSLAFTEKQAAQNAQFTVNSLALERSTNKIDDVVPGVSFDLKSAGTSTVTLTANFDAIKTKVKKYVDAHNQLIGFINAEIHTPTTTGDGGAFNGESAVRNLKFQILSQNGSGIFPGVSLTQLAEIGLSLDKDGALKFDETEFDEAAGDNLADVTSLLTTKGDFVKGDAGFSIFDLPDDVAPGKYTVAITQAATKATATAGAAFASGGLGADEKLTFTVSGKSIDVQLKAGDTLAQSITKINGAFNAADVDIKASDDSGTLKIGAIKAGSKLNFSAVSNVASGATSTGVGTSALTGTGLDVIGTIDGVAATGDGEFLKGNTGTAFEGVRLRYVGTGPGSTELTVGPDGFFVRMDELLDDSLDPDFGAIATRIEGLGDSIDNIDDRIETTSKRVEEYRAVLERRFTALEELIGKLNSQQTFLATYSFPS